MSAVPDVIDHLLNVAPGSPLDTVRRGRPQARDNAQNSYLALFEPKEPSGLSRLERFAVAVFVAGLHGAAPLHGFYAAELGKLAEPGVIEAVEGEIAAGATQGPYGTYPPGPLSRENRPGPHHRVGPAGRTILGPRLAAALDHAHLLVFRPRDASSADLQALQASGLSTTEIVTLSQLVAFLTFQVRVVAGLGTLAGATS